MSNYAERALQAHQNTQGKWTTGSSMPLETKDDLSIAYTPGVAEPCRVIAADSARAYDLTMKGRTVAVVSDGSSVLGLGNIGPEAGLPVMEGKAVLYKKYADIDAVPLVLASQEEDAIVEAVRMIAPTFGGIHLEDIAAPTCFAVERRLTELLDIPVMHDDQHATAIVTLAALHNALKVTGKKMEEISVVINGAGAAGIAIAWLLLEAGVTSMVMCDSQGIIALGRAGMNPYKDELAERINATGRTGTLADALIGADLFVGVSKPGVLTGEMIRAMAPQSIVFALANPTPEIMPEEAHAAGVAVMATGRSDFPNQVNNVLVYPGLFRGLLDARASKLTPDAKLAAARALADLVPEPTAEHIIPSILALNPAEAIRRAVGGVDENGA
jgi:malate dehydrogenase (oxaloacetate-decarboxylating)